MNSFLSKPIVISHEQSVSFLNSLIKPDEKYISYRNTIFNEIDRTINIQKKDMDMEVEIQNLDLSFIDEMKGENCIGSWFISIQLENLVRESFDFWNSDDKDWSTYTNLKENSIMHETDADGQMQIAS